jgi:hypothetical protein
MHDQVSWRTIEEYNGVMNRCGILIFFVGIHNGKTPGPSGDQGGVVAMPLAVIPPWIPPRHCDGHDNLVAVI